MLVFGAAVIAGCDDGVTAVSSAANQRGTYITGAADTPADDLQVEDRFTFDIDVRGSLKPGHAIHLTLRGKANFATEDAEVRLTLPEVSAAERSGWAVVELPVGEASRPQIQMRRAFAAGEEFRQRTTITIPEPGYYYVIATAKQYSHDGITDLPHQVTDVSTRSLWLWVDEQGGRITAELDTTLFSPDVRKERGPRASKYKPRVKGKGDAYIACSVYPSDPNDIILQACPGTGYPPPPSSGTATHAFRATYDNADAGHTFTPVQNARVTWNISVAGTGAAVSNGNATTDANGNIPAIDCQGATNERNIAVQVHTLDDRVSVSYTQQQVAGHWSGPCGGMTDVRLDPLMAHLFINLQKTVLGHAKHFLDYPAKRIYAGMYDDGRTYYDYKHIDGEMHIFHSGTVIWGAYGAYAAAHEYGHHYQDKYLYLDPPDKNGLMRLRSSSCPSPHPPESASTLACAWSEAFADWYAVLVREAATGRWVSDLEENWYYKNCLDGWSANRGHVVCTTDGSVVEGAIASFMWDLSDPSNEAHDQMQVHPRVLVDAITKCQVHPKSRVYTPYISYTGIDHLIHCSENRSPYEIEIVNYGWRTFFNTRAQADWPDRVLGTGFARASDPFRRVWMVNLYSKRPEVSTFPFFREMTPEDPPYVEPEPEPDPEPCSDPTQLQC